MGARKTNLAFSRHNAENISSSKIDIVSLIKKSQIEEKREKLIKFYFFTGLVISIFAIILLITL